MMTSPENSPLSKDLLNAASLTNTSEEFRANSPQKCCQEEQSQEIQTDTSHLSTTAASSIPMVDAPTLSPTTVTVAVSALAASRPTRPVRRPPPTVHLPPLRRASSRTIKKRKFDDELVESSLVKVAPGVNTRQRTQSGASNTSTSTDHASITTETPQPVVSLTPLPANVNVEKKKLGRTAPKRHRKQKSKSQQGSSSKDLGRWKPTDDLALIIAVQQTNDLQTVHTGTKFSCRFTLKDVQERWYALLYDPVISRLATQAMCMLHPDIVSAIHAKALFSKAEEDLLGDITANSQPSLSLFEELLQKYPTVFFPGRTAESLHTHWLLLKQYHLLPDQTVQPMPRGDHVLNFSDAEDVLNDDDLKESSNDPSLEHELSLSDRRAKREIRNLEQELPKWQVLVDSVTGISPPDFDNQTLAVLRGRLVRYLMRSREITLGRTTSDNNVDVDLSLEGPAWKISRKQGIIKLRSNGDFFILNEGKRPIYIDGKPVLTGNKFKLSNNSVVEISCLRFIFLINQELINVIRAEAARTS